MIKKKNIKFIIFSAIILYFFIFSDIGIISRIQQDRKIKEDKNKIEQLQNEKEILRMQINKLNRDYNYIADEARKLGYARPGEKIYRFLQRKDRTNKIKIAEKTNKKPSFEIKFMLKDYLVYIITFIVVIAIYVILLITKKE